MSSSCLIIYHINKHLFFAAANFHTLNLYRLSTFYLFCFQCHETSPRVSLCKMSCQCSFLWDIFILWTKNIFFIYIDKFVLTNFLWISRVSQIVTISVFPRVSYFFYNSIYVQFEFHFYGYHFSFLCCIFIFTGQFAFSIICFYKTTCGFIPGRQGDNTTMCFALCVSEMSNRCTVTNQMDSKRNDVIGHRSWCVPFTYIVIRELATKFVLYAITHS